MKDANGNKVYVVGVQKPSQQTSPLCNAWYVPWDRRENWFASELITTLTSELQEEYVGEWMDVIHLLYYDRCNRFTSPVYTCFLILTGVRS